MGRLDIVHCLPDEIVLHHRSLIEGLVDSAPTVEWLDLTDPPAPANPIIPRRLYCAVAAVDAALALSGEPALVAACLGSRSHDGYLRQRSVETLLSDLRSWTIPFLLEALGDHVIEIVETLDGRIPGSLVPEFARHLIANEEHFIRLCRRCVSYWNEYDRYRYDGLYPEWSEYPGARIIEDLNSAAGMIDPLFAGKVRRVLPGKRR